MTDIPDAAIEAAAEAHYEAEFGQPWAYVLDAARETYRLRVRAAIEAAMPAIREAIAQEINDARDVVLITVAEATGKDPFNLTVGDRNYLDRVAVEFNRIVRGTQ